MGEKKEKTSAPRVSREEAENKLVLALIALLGERPINEITVDVIADTAGLKSGHVLVHRYFDSRSGLVSRTAHELTNLIVHQINTDLQRSKDDTMSNPMLIMAASMENVKRRSFLINELMLHGAPSAPHSVDSARIIAAMTECFERMNLSHRVARITAVRVLALMIVNTAYHDWMGSTDKEVADLRQFDFFQIMMSMEIAKAAGWDQEPEYE